MTERRSEWLYLIIGLVIGTAWFAFNRWVDFGPYPVMADAVTYLQISNSFNSFGDAFTYAADRTFGFPFTLYFIKRITEIFTTLSPEGLDAVQTATLLIFHFFSSIFFYRALQKYSKSYGLRLHPAALVLILVHPGLISHTSVLLTDTFTADLIMIVMVLLLGARDAVNRAFILRAIAGGLILGWAVATRPFLVVTAIAIFGLVFALAIIFKRPKRLLGFLALMICSFSLVLLPSVLSCRATYGKVCMQNPAFAGLGAQSMQMGLTSIRTYWSSRSESTVMPQDWSMVESWKSSCDIIKVSRPSDWLGCVFSKPLFAPVYLGKKLIAVMDSFFLQPYASDVTPSWVRRYSRAFGAVSFVGFFCAIGILFIFLRQKRTWEALAISLPILALCFQLPMHVEGRYSFSAVPVCLVSVVWLFQKAINQGRRATVAYLLMAIVLGGTFLMQTHLWDLDDPILQQIEGWDR